MYSPCPSLGFISHLVWGEALARINLVGTFHRRFSVTQMFMWWSDPINLPCTQDCAEVSARMPGTRSHRDSSSPISSDHLWLCSRSSPWTGRKDEQTARESGWAFQTFTLMHFSCAPYITPSRRRVAANTPVQTATRLRKRDWGCDGSIKLHKHVFSEILVQQNWLREALSA